MSNDTRHLWPEEIAAYQRRTLPPGDLLRVDDHLAGCGECRGRIDGAERIGRAVTAMHSDLADVAATLDHPVPAQLASLVDGRLEDVELELVESHLEICPSCAEDVEDLRAVRLSLAGSSVQETPRGLPAYAAIAALAAGLAGLLVWIGIRPAPTSEHEPSRAEAPVVEPAVSPPVNPPRLTLDDGGATVTIHADGSAHGLPSLAPDQAHAIRLALEEGRVRLPRFLGDLGAPSGTLMGAAVDRSAFQPLRPMATAVETDRPTLEWMSLEGATAYVVSVFDLDFNRVAESPSLSATRWRPETGLTRGRTYVWQVRASLSDREVVAPAPPAPEARFRVLPLAEADRLSTLRSRYGKFHLVLGVLLAQAGALEEAERELERLVAANPGRPEAQKLLDDLRTQRQGLRGRW